MINGILLIDKPLIYTSHDIVDAVRRKIGQKRVGHAGTLDPMATGLLVVLLGSCTSYFEKLSASDKRYDGVITLGVETETLDAEGVIRAEQPTTNVTVDKIESAMRGLVGPIEQTIPKYSSAKIKGRKGYQLARKGVEFQPRTKQVTVHEFRMNAYQEPDVYFDSYVSKGTYLRALASDIGAALGTGGMLSALRRISAGGYSLPGAIALQNFVSADPTFIRNHIKANAELIAAEACGTTR